MNAPIWRKKPATSISCQVSAIFPFKPVQIDLAILDSLSRERSAYGMAELVRQRRYPNRSEAIHLAVRDLLKEELWTRSVLRGICSTKFYCRLNGRLFPGSDIYIANSRQSSEAGKSLIAFVRYPILRYHLHQITCN